jgi:hypothetical protein
MPEAQHEVETYVAHIVFPASKEELINGLLVRNAPARMVALIHLAQQQGTLDRAESRAMKERLEAAFADLRGTMSEVYDYRAPIDPHRDLPRKQD